MRRFAGITIGMATLALIGALLVASSGAGSQIAPAAGDARVPVVVELFTSEGCSTCPPADALLRRLETEQPVANAEIIVLGEHVDYWNYIGWTDRFSSAQYSDRQTEYARRFRLDSVYTPQMVVDGREELNGTDERAARQAITRAVEGLKAKLAIQVADVPASRTVKVTISCSELPPASKAKRAKLFLALTETGLESQVKRGENGGRTLRHTGVVRLLKSVDQVDLTKGSFHITTDIRPSSDLQRKNARVIAFIQDEHEQILGAASAPLPGQ
jgi:hypothetical protein